jgi:predicted AlkP superfamily phosphohydrolase/phosphomutase
MFFAYIDPGTGYTIFSIGAWLVAFLVGFLGILSFFFKKIFSFFSKYKKPILFLIFILILVGIGAIIMSKKETKFDKKIIILGMDGLSPEIIEPMMEEGKLPNFTRLKEHGSYSHLSSTNPSQSPVAWTGFATGQNPGKNGIFDFIYRDPNNYRLQLSTTHIKGSKVESLLKGVPFWKYTSDKKITTVIITCPVTFPPQKIYGRMLSGMGVPDILGTQGTFSFYTTEPLQKDEDIGGKVFHVERNPAMNMSLIGPRRAKLGGRSENVKIPFTVTIKEDKHSIIIEWQNNRCELKENEWSDWQDVTFNLGPTKRVKGILKFYLAEISPEFKLYVSPINFDPRDPFFQISYPKNYSKQLAEKIGLFYTQGMPCHTWAVNEKRLTEEPFLKETLEVLREKIAMLDVELERFERGILFCYFETPDIIQHMFWRYTDSKHPLCEKDAPKKYKDMKEEWYKKMDIILGKVMNQVDKDDVVIVLSDHGFNTFRRVAHVNTWLRQNGYLALKNQVAKSGAELLQDIDWSKTKAYSIGFGAVYINQEGRERDGIVKPGKETELLKKEISKKLKEWFDGKFNQPVVNSVYAREEIFWGPYAYRAPDLYIGFNIGYRASWQTALGAVPSELLEDNLKKWSGDHLFDPKLIPGVLFLNRQVTKENPSIYDIAPTILKIVGFDEQRLKDLQLDGESLL